VIVEWNTSDKLHHLNPLPKKQDMKEDIPNIMRTKYRKKEYSKYIYNFITKFQFNTHTCCDKIFFDDRLAFVESGFVENDALVRENDEEIAADDNPVSSNIFP
jgi:hypothetical protein